MGTVYAARDPLLDRRVALKVLHHPAGVPDVRERILREGRALARLSHPSVVSIYDVGEEDGRLFLTMEMIAGVTLGAWLRSERRAWRDVLAIFLQAGDALAAAHAAGVVHGDFKPDNVIVARDGRAFVMDFGLARLHVPGLSERSPVVAGTPRYMAPEQLEGRVATPASDQFSFCTVLREALERASPPRWLSSIALRGLERDPARRFTSMDALLAAARRNLGGSVHVAINGVLQIAMFVFHASITALFLWAMLSEAQGAHAAYSPSTERVATVLAWWLAGIFFTGWAPVGVIWTALNAYGLFRKRRWAITSTLIYCAIALLTCLGTPIAIYGLVTLWPLRKKIATSR